MYEPEKKRELTPVSQRFIEAYNVIARRPNAPNKTDFCKSVGLSPSNWSKYERGERPFDVNTLVEMTIHYNVSSDYLLLGQGDMFRPKSEVASSTTTNTANIENNSGIGINTGTVTLEACQRELEAMRRDAASYQREIELLKGQLETKDNLIASKDELLNFLRSGFNRPN